MIPISDQYVNWGVATYLLLLIQNVVQNLWKTVQTTMTTETRQPKSKVTVTEA